MSNWNKSYGHNFWSGNRVIMIEEQAEEPFKLSIPLIGKLSLICLKGCYWIAAFVLVPLLLLLGLIGA